ncbi:LEM domain-containing protein Bocksbeutel [Zeugodacus cucurbitae]|uniref:Otefin n=1 Tax=Zeugodacus cucurbitae TaxID=28588 RepID=A0A0A1X2T2_ZEUCU|nr:LEM domain-containing protein Bocksbeutel [Zeugodacus cucurbitae]
MSKKIDHPELRAQLKTLNNKELHYKCVEYGMNVPVADSTRDVIIRKLIKSITGDSNVASSKGSKKQVTSPSERRKTVNVTVHVSSDEEDAGRQIQRSAIKSKTRTQSPKGHNVTFDTSLSNNRSNVTVATAEPMYKNVKSADTNSNVGIGFGNRARIVPLEVNTPNEIEYLPSDLDDGYKSTSTNLNFSQTRTYGEDRREIPISSYKSSLPNLGFSQTRTLNTTYQQNDAQIPRQGLFSTPQEYNIGSPNNSFNIENMASHSSTLGSSLGGISSYSKDPIFKRPTALSKSNVTNTSYNQADAQRLYPRLPTDLATSSFYTASNPSTPDSQMSTNSSRAPSLTKSGVMTTSYYQEITPVKEVKHFDVANEEETSIDGAGDHSRKTMPATTNYDRNTYVAGMQRGSEAHSPFEPHMQPSFNLSSRYSSDTFNKETYIPSNTSPNAQSSPKVKRYSTTGRANTSYTRSIDEPDSFSEGEQLSGDEIYVQDSEEEEYLAGGKKIYSSYGSNKVQERVPYRRSNSARLSASPSPRYSSSAMGRHSLNHDNEDDDVDATLKNFLTTLDRKYHIKQMLYMFAVFASAVFIYVVFFEKTPIDEDS